MALVINGVGVVGVASALFVAALGAMVYRARPDRFQNRILAIVLWLDAWFVGTGSGLMYLTDVPAHTYGWQLVTYVAAAVLVPAYLLFLSTLPTPLARPLRVPLVRIGLMAAAAIAGLFVVVNRTRFVAGVQPGTLVPWHSVCGPWCTWIQLHYFSSALLVGLVFTLSAVWATPRGTIARSRAKSYAWAFAIRDLGLLLAIISFSLPPTWPGPRIPYAGTAFGASVVLVFGALLAYGILRHQLFDIDLKIKWTMKRSTVVALFVAFFFIVSESAALFFGNRIGPYLGIIAAGLLLFAIAPLQRLAERVSDAAMPHVEDTPAYRTRRQEEIFRAALEEALTDEGVTLKERRLLLRLQKEMGLAPDAAQRLEREVLGERGVTSSR